MTKYNYAKAAEYKVLGWFWDVVSRKIGFLREYTCSVSLFGMSNTQDDISTTVHYKNFEFYDLEVAKKYELPEIKIVPFDTALELVESEFWGKPVKENDTDNSYRIVDVCHDLCDAEYWFENYTTIDGRRIGKVK